MRKSKPQNGRRMDVKRELLQVVLCQINIFFHPNTTTSFFSDCPEIQTTSFASFEFQNNLCKPLYYTLVYLTK